MRTKGSRFLAALISVVIVLSTIVLPVVPASAASAEYPAQLTRISTSDNSRNINISGTGSGSALNTYTTNGVQNENWRFDYKNGLFKIVNQGTGMVLTPENGSTSSGTKCVISPDAEKNYQYWRVESVSTDSLGNALHYKITNYENSSMALTYNSSSNTITLSSYSGSSNQKFLLNAAGLTGFGGYAKDMSGNAKAATIGGLLGETVYVDTFDELASACSDATPRTIVITGNISKTGTYSKDSNGRYGFSAARIYVYPNKTIIGSYSANSLYNVYFRTYEGNYGKGNNIILRNITISHDKELNNDNIWEFSYGWNFWIDHCTFVGHSSVNGASTGTDDWDKFLNFKGTTDYATISDCKFGLHEYGVLLGYPADTQADYNTYNGKPCITLATNYYNDCITRAPALLRYGYFHSINNYVINFDMGYTIYTASKLYAEGNYYDGGTRKGSVVNDGTSTSDISYKYPGQYTEVNSTLVNSNYSLKASTAGACSWRPSSNYSYTAKSANDAKSYCSSYSGAQSSRSKMTYASFASVGMPSASYITTGPVATPTPTPVPTATPVPDVVYHFDFGDGAIQDGYARVTASTLYSSSSNFGFISQSQSSMTRNPYNIPSGYDNLHGDQIEGNNTFRAKMPNGEYVVVAHYGSWNTGYGTRYNIEGVDSGALASTDAATYAARVKVTDGVLDVVISKGDKSYGGYINGLDILSAPAYTYKYDFGNGAAQAGFAKVNASTSYDARVGYGFIGSQGDMERGANNAVPGYENLYADQVESGSTTFRADVPNGEYVIAIHYGSWNSAFGTRFNVEGIDSGALASADATLYAVKVNITDGKLDVGISAGDKQYGGYISGLEILPVPAKQTKFDFGNTAQSGYALVTPTTFYSAATGYGFTNTISQSVMTRNPYNIPSEYAGVHDDQIESGNATFKADVANGEYIVIIHYGSWNTGYGTRYNVEGVDSGALASTDAAQYIARVKVTDGVLDVGISAGDKSYGGYINGLEILEAAPIPYNYDFGDVSAQDGYAQVTSSTMYSKITGYGFVGSQGGMTRNPYNIPSGLEGVHNDQVEGTTTFKAELPNGKYSVTVHYGSWNTGYGASYNIEGVESGPLASTDAATYTAEVTVTDGVLDVGIAPGSKSYGGYINGLTIVPIVSDGIYMIKNANSGLYLDVAGGTAANGTNVQQWASSFPGASYNNWKVISNGDGSYKIYSMISGGNTYLLDLANGSTANGTNIQIWENTNSNAQDFIISGNSDGTFRVLTKATNGGSGLDVNEASTLNGANVQQWGYTGSSHQHWVFEYVDALPTPEPTATPEPTPTPTPIPTPTPTPAPDLSQPLWWKATETVVTGDALMAGLVSAGDLTYTEKAITVDGEDFTGYVNGTVNGKYNNGVFAGNGVIFTAPADGEVTAYMEVGSGKNIRITDAEDNIIIDWTNDGEKVSTTITSEVEAGKTYYLYVAGSNARIYGVRFDSEEVLANATPVPTATPTPEPTVTPTPEPTATPTPEPTATPTPEPTATPTPEPTATPTPEPTATPTPEPTATPTPEPTATPEPTPESDLTQPLWWKATKTVATGDDLMAGLISAGDLTYTEKAITVDGEDFTGYVNGTVNGKYNDGVFAGNGVIFTAPANGEVTAYMEVGSGKTIIISDSEDNHLVDWTNDGEKVSTTITAEVEAGKTYYLYVAGSNARIYGVCFISEYVEEEEEVLLGDVSGDGLINPNDAVLVLRNSAKLIDLTPEQFKAADVNKDDVVNPNDAVLILRYSAKLIDSFD